MVEALDLKSNEYRFESDRTYKVDKYPNRYGKSLDDYIMFIVGSNPDIEFKDLYIELLNNYGNVNTRTVHRRLLEMIPNRIKRTKIDRNHIYYRLSKTRKYLL